MTISEILNEAETLCSEANKDVHPSRLLLMHLLNLESYELFAAIDENVKNELVNTYFYELNRYIEDNEPIQYIIGYEYFAGRNLFVDKGALIPRPETEELVYELLFLLDNEFDTDRYEKIRAVDVGTGSGAIALSIAAEEPRVQMVATDISEEALVIAKKNAQTYNLDVEFIAGDMLTPLIEQNRKFDVLISNPPYIPQEEKVQDIVLENEPHVALFGGKDGLYFYQTILENAHKILMEDKYLLAFEIGFNQADRLMILAKKYFPEADIWIKKDMQEKNRMLFIKK